MKKTITTSTYICDFEHKTEIEAVGKVMPSKKDVCSQHLKAFTKEIRLPKSLGGEMSGYKIAVDPNFKPRFKIMYKETK